MKATFSNSTKVLVAAFKEGNIAPQYSTTGIIGHLIADGMGYKYGLYKPQSIFQLILMDGKAIPAYLDKEDKLVLPKWVDAIKVEHDVEQGEKATATHFQASLRVQTSVNMTAYENDELVRTQLNSTGYDLIQLSSIGAAFESEFFSTLYSQAPKDQNHDLALYNGVIGVIKVLGSIHAMPTHMIEEVCESLKAEPTVKPKN